MIDRSHDLSITSQAKALKHQPEQCLLPASSRACGRSRHHAPDRRAASRLSVRGQPDAARSLECRGCGDRPSACRHADEAHGHRGDLPPARTPQSRHQGTRSTRTLLRDLPITGPNQVWAMDITYIPMARGFVYLAAVIDWFSRRVLAWRLSITMEAAFCVEALEEALARHGRPEIFNTDQGSQFTSEVFTGVLTRNRDRDQHGRQGCLARQRLRRAALAIGQVRGGLPASLRHGRRGPRLDRPVSRLLQQPRPHSSLDRRTPDQAYFTTCRRSRRPEFRRRFRGVTPVGLRPPCVPPRKRHPTATGRGSTYPERKSVQTKPATSR